MSLKATITYQGQAYVYPGGNLPCFDVRFEADGRITFHLGVLGAVPKDQDIHQPFVMGAYDVVVSKDEAKVFDAHIPAHWWNARWTYYPTATGPAVIRLPDDLVAARRMFPFGDTGCKVDSQPNTVPYFYMGWSNVVKYMPTTGERPDIGLVTDNSGYYMLGKSAYGMIAWGHVGNTTCMHFRDQNTGKPIDLIKYPSANAYSEQGKQGSPWMCRGKQIGTSIYCEYGDGSEPQQAHYCEMSYMAYCATKNPAFLEDLQYSANFTVFCDAAVSGQRKIATVSGEYRGVAWAFRNLFMAHVATLDAEAAGTLPEGCHPSSYWKTLLDNQLAYYATNMLKPDNQTFRLVTGIGRFGPWQVDYMLMALAFGVLTGHSDWAPLYLWALKNAIDRCSNSQTWQQGGFPPGWGTPYYLEPKATWWDAFVYSKDDPQSPGSGPTQAQIDALKIAPLNGGKAMQGNEYFMTTRAALTVADYLDKLGLANVRATYPEFDAALKNAQTMFENYGTVNARVSIISEGGIMPDTYTIESGKHGFIPVTPNGTLSSGPDYTTDNPAIIVALHAAEGGVNFDAGAEGVAHITATAQGAVSISHTVEITVTAPLATATALEFGDLVVS